MQQLLQRLVLPLAQRASELALFYEMLEVISKEPVTRRFASVALFLGFIIGTYWFALIFLKAISEFIIILC